MEVRKLSTFCNTYSAIIHSVSCMPAYRDVCRTTHFFICPSIVYLPTFPDDSYPHQYLRMIVVSYFHSLFLLLSALYSHALLNRDTSF